MDNVDAVFTEACRAFLAGGRQEAASGCRTTLGLDPAHQGALNLLGLLASADGDLWQAASLFGRAARLEPRNPYVLSNLGEALFHLGRPDEAQEVLEAALRMDPNLPQAKLVHQRVVKANVERVARTFGERAQLIATVHFRPARADGFGLVPDTPTDETVAIVLQGPLLVEADFTLETVRMYRKMFPEAGILVSTWEGEDPGQVERIREAGATVIQSVPPEHRGPRVNGDQRSNINMQVRSAAAGVRWAQERGFGYCLKTRTDFRFYNPSLLVNCLALQAAFPLTQAGRQAKRLVAFSNIVRYMPYVLPDMHMFGTMKDMLDYWTPPEDTRGEIVSEGLIGIGKARHGESWFLTHYAEQLGRTLAWTLEDSWEIFRDHFVFIDVPSADVYWPKYAAGLEYRWRCYEFSASFQEFGFAEWLRLYTGRHPMNADPRIVLRGGGQSISDILLESRPIPGEREPGAR
ncbi:WavE lipopolysaccharide synthesis family protein [Azospirillum sp. sgz301742]